jgi:hypothetical protein
MKKMNWILFAVILGVSCSQTDLPNKSGIEGLWVIKKVVVGEDIMTPNARWQRFFSDSTQVSGNGWKQHSIGKWQFNQSDSSLRIVNTNGLRDPAGPFRVALRGDRMEWNRTEDGMKVTVNLERTDELPMTYVDHALGLWTVKEIEGTGPFLNEQAETLFIRWDGRFVIGNALGRINGVYNVHGHRPEFEFIPYGEEFKRSFWSFETRENKMEMRLLNSDSSVTRVLERIHEFPE